MKVRAYLCSECLRCVLILATLSGFVACNGSSRQHTTDTLLPREDFENVPEIESLGTYPRPDMVRQSTTVLTGEWSFAYDPEDVGLAEKWYLAPAFSMKINVPFCIESEASGIGDPDPPPVVWYARTFSYHDTGALHTLLHFGAVDYHAMVWLNGIFIGEHFGGYTPFTFEVRALLRSHNTLVVRVEDRLNDTRPRGKQSLSGRPYQVFYETVTGLWQPVWLEDAGPVYVERFRVMPDPAAGKVGLTISLAGITDLVTVTAIAHSPHNEWVIATASFEKTDAVQSVSVALSFDNLELWSPDDPNLYPLRLVVRTKVGKDVVDSYFGVRTIEVADGDILLNGRYLYQKLILNQGFYSGGHYTPVDPVLYRRDIELIKEFGFNGLRMHEKIESPQLLFWADVVGALVWEELPTAWRFCDEQKAHLEREWREAIQRDANHPSLITWVPFNEAWGLGITVTPLLSLPVVLFPDRIDFMKHMVAVTKEMDPTRLVIDNSGWDHTEATDVVDIHQYLPRLEQADALYKELEDLSSYRWSVRRLLKYGNNVFAPGEAYRGQPLIVSEYGGFGYYWGKPQDLVHAYRTATELIQAQPHIDGYCYTQFNDTYQEKNGLVDMDRNPIVPPEDIRAINNAR